MPRRAAKPLPKCPIETVPLGPERDALNARIVSALRKTFPEVFAGIRVSRRPRTRRK